MAKINKDLLVKFTNSDDKKISPRAKPLVHEFCYAEIVDGSMKLDECVREFDYERSDAITNMARRAVTKFVPGEYYLFSGCSLYQSDGIICIDSLQDDKDEDDVRVYYHAVAGFEKDLSEYELDSDGEKWFYEGGLFADYLTHIAFPAKLHPREFQIKEGAHCGGCPYLGKARASGVPCLYECQITGRTRRISDECDCLTAVDETSCLERALSKYLKV